MKKLSHTARNIRYAVKRAQGIRIETDLRPYEKIIANVRRMDAARWPAGSLRRRMESLRAAIAAGTPPETVLPEAFALVTRACRLALEQEPYDVQVIAGLAMTGGKVAQMNTGEGKTMAAVFPACLRALSGKGFHILTANEYLARRDSEWMGAVYSLLGLTAAHVTEGMTAAEKRAAYRADITYLTARQAGFDFLADRLALSPQEPVQRELFSVLVDEADFILIDESRNPLIIARTGALSGPDPVKADETARILIPGRDYTVDREERNCFLTPAGERKVMRRHGCGGMEEPEFLPVYASIHVALLARNLLHRDVDYIVRSGRVELVDEWTGRVADNRRWPHGIQAAIEVKEGLVPRPDGKIYGKITIQHYVNLYERRAGMTATAVPAAEEFVRIYGMPVVVIPPAHPSRMVHLPDTILGTRVEKTRAVVEEIGNAHASGKPVLVGTASVRESRELGALLGSEGIPCRILNAENDAREAEIVAEAGVPGAVTISTNMAGRGTDIRLGGTGELYRDAAVRAGGLHVIGTNRYESRRVDDQLRGRAGRQGDPGSSAFFVSLEDDLFRKYGVHEFLGKTARLSGGGAALAGKRTSGEIDRAQRIIEGRHGEMRRTLFRYSLFMEILRKEKDKIRTRALLDRRFPETIEAMLDGNGDGGSARADRERLLVPFLRTIDEFWSDMLAFAEDLKEGIHLRRFSGRDPLLEFTRDFERVYQESFDRAVSDLAETLAAGTLPPPEEPRGGERSSNTWTYQVNDDPLPAFNLSMIGGANIGFAAVFGLFAWIFPLIGLFRKKDSVGEKPDR